MPDDFAIARNPDDSTLPYRLRVPLGPTGVILKSRGYEAVLNAGQDVRPRPGVASSVEP